MTEKVELIGGSPPYQIAANAWEAIHKAAAKKVFQATRTGNLREAREAAKIMDECERRLGRQRRTNDDQE